MANKLILLSGPSGSGKGTLCAYVRKEFPAFVSPTSWTTRAPREGELEGLSGKKYRFVTEAEFKKKIAEGGFLEWAQYSNNYYGTPKDEVLEGLSRGSVFQELEVQGVEQLLAAMPREQLALIFVTAESWEALRGRILLRGAMPEEELERRRKRYEEELRFKDRADYVLLNAEGKLAETEERLKAIIGEIIGK